MALTPPFLAPEFADENGLVAIGGDLLPGTLLRAYRSGVFPWFDEGDPILWWSPDPRAIIELDGLHISRRLARTIRSGPYRVTLNQSFGQVIRGCADRAEGSWITKEMIAAYETLHRLGHAHSVEVWLENELAGGIYGVAIGGFFAGESMFTRIRDGSKIALVALVERLRQGGFQLFDVQFVTPHTMSMGATEIPRETYLERLHAALTARVSFGELS